MNRESGKVNRDAECSRYFGLVSSLKYLSLLARAASYTHLPRGPIPRGGDVY